MAIVNVFMLYVHCSCVVILFRFFNLDYIFNVHLCAPHNNDPLKS